MPLPPDYAYTDIDEAQEAVRVAIRETCLDMGLDPDQDGDEFASDLVESIALQCDAATARELCRVELAYVPQGVMRYFPGMRPVEVY